MMIRLFGISLFAFSLVASQSCSERCNDSVDDSFPCQCNSFCDTHKDCCFDYIELCAPEGTCSGRCRESFNPDNSCHCTPECEKYNNCCLDYNEVCNGGTATDSCVGRCDGPLDTSYSCQCNSACEIHGDCCSDYYDTCSIPSGCVFHRASNAEFLQVSLDLFDLDTEKALPGDVLYNPQSQTSTSSSTDKSPEPLFTYVNDALLQQLNFLVLINLLDNYEKKQGINENESPDELAEQEVFLDEFMASNIGIRLFNFFSENNIFGCSLDETTFKNYIKLMWFEFYSRQNGAKDTSGFEHVFVGEIKSSTTSGFHNWVQFYLEEIKGNLNYHGYINWFEPSLYGTQFTWHGYLKKIGGGAIGVSPQYELAVFTLCHVLQPDQACNIYMRDDSGNVVTRSIQTYTWSNSSPGYGLKYIASAYFLT